MTDVNALLDAMQARCDGASEGPWSATHGPHELPRIWSDAPQFESAEYIAKCAFAGDVVDAEFIAAARQDLPRLIAAVRAVLALHRRVGIYVECDCTDEQKQDGHEDIYEVGLTCNRIYDICGECCRDDVYQREDCADRHDHTIDGDYCPTVTAVLSALSDKSQPLTN